MFQLVAISDAFDAFLRRIAQITGWLFVVLAVVIIFDVITRKVGFQLPYFTSTRLQELEWHFGATIFLGWIAYGVSRNTHVRIDVFTGNLPQETKDKIDLFGILVFALPYCFIALPYSFDFFMVSLGQLESSDAPNGLPARYVIKGILAFGMFLLLIATITMLCRKIVDVFGPPELHSSNRMMKGIEV